MEKYTLESPCVSMANVVKVSYDEIAYHDGIAAAVGKPGEDVYVYAENAAAAWWTVSDDPPERAAGSALATGLRWWPPEARRRRLVDTLDGTLLHVLATIRTSAETAAPLVAAVANLTADVYTLGNATGAPIKEVASPYAHPLIFLFFGGFLLTLLLFLAPQTLNFVLSVPQLFKLIPCPRHRMPRYGVRGRQGKASAA